MTTEVDFSLTLQLAGSHLRQWLVLVFFRLRKEKVPVGKKKKEERNLSACEFYLLPCCF